MDELGQEVDSERTGSATRNIGKELNASEKELNGLSEAVGELFDRLGPISLRRDEKAKAETGPQPDKVRCEVDSAIYSINCRISLYTEKLRVMITELQL